MQKKLPLTFLALAVVALFLGEFPCGEATQAEIKAEADEAGQPSDENCRGTAFENDHYVVTKGAEIFKYHKLSMSGDEVKKAGAIEEGEVIVLNSTKTQALFNDWITKRKCVTVSYCW